MQSHRILFWGTLKQHQSNYLFDVLYRALGTVAIYIDEACNDLAAEVKQFVTAWRFLEGLI